jgi:hypothetical protein
LFGKHLVTRDIYLSQDIDPPCWIVMPNSKFNFYWTITMQLLLLYSTIFVPFSIAFFESESAPIIVLNCVIDILFVLDFIKTFVTA